MKRQGGFFGKAAVPLAMCMLVVAGCAQLSEEDRAYLDQLRSDVEASAEQARMAAKEAGEIISNVSQYAAKAADRAEEARRAADKAEAVFLRTLSK